MPRKIKTVIVENGFEREVEIEVADGPPASWGDLSKLRILGKRNPRLEGPEKVTGRAKYASDVVLPGMLYGRYVTSTYAAASIKSIDLSPAERMPGVKAVLAIKQAGQPVMFAGEPIAAVAAETPEIAEDALRAVKITYEPKRFVVNPDRALASGAPLVRPDVPGNLSQSRGATTGDVDGAFKTAYATIEGTYEAQTRLHCCLETHGHTVKWDGDKLTAWSSTQHIEGCRTEFASLTSGPDKVQVICEHMGGGFGSKFGASLEGITAAKLAKAANAPVKFMLTRWDEQYHNFRGPGVRAEVKLAAAMDGTLLASDVATFNNGGTGNAGTPIDNGFFIIQPAAVRTKAQSVLTNTGGIAALRAPGHPQAALVWDMALDQMAARLNMDPLDFRKKNHSDNVRVAEWDLGAKIIGWNRRQRVPGTARGVVKRGIGMGSATWGGGGRQTADSTVVIGRDGSVTSYLGVQDLGTGVRNYQSGIVAEELGLELHQVKAKIGDTSYGKGHGSGGSTTTPSVAPAVKMAAMDAKLKLTLAAAKILKVKPEEVEVGLGGRFYVKENPKKGISWKQLCATLPPTGLKATGLWNADLAASGVRGCNFAEVEVDTETGKVRVLKVVGVQDCGVVLNRLQAESQMTGSIVQGIGTAILEARHMDNLTGRMLNPNFEEYKLCGALEAAGVNITMDPPYRTLNPEEHGVVTVVIDNPTGKVSGIGEPAIVAVHAAIANAIFNAIGVHVTEPPATPDKVLAALARKKGATV